MKKNNPLIIAALAAMLLARGNGQSGFGGKEVVLPSYRCLCE